MSSLGYKRPVIMQSMYIFKVHFLLSLCVQLLINLYGCNNFKINVLLWHYEQ